MQRLTGFDAAFLALESATNHMHLASLLVVDPRGAPESDGAWSFERVRRLVERRLEVLPPFRRRLVSVPLGIHHPLWAEEADVDLGFHVRRAGLPQPGGATELADVVGDLMGRPLDRSRPLWELHVIEGLEEDRAAVLIKAHHCAVDGVSATELLLRLLDDGTVEGGADGSGERDADGDGAGQGAGERDADGAGERDGARAGQGDGERDADGAGERDGARAGQGDGDGAGHGAGERDGARAGQGDDPPRRVSGDASARGEQAPSEAELIGAAVAALPGTDQLVRAAQRVAVTVVGLRHRNAAAEADPPPSPFTAPPTSLNVRIGSWRRVAWARLPRDDVHAVTGAFGGTANDVVLALCSGALQSYFDERGERPDGDLVALVPASVRSRRDRASLGNRVSPMLVSLATRTESPVERFRAISRGVLQARAQDRTIDNTVLSEVAELFVPALARPAARLASRLLTGGALPPAFNVIVSNLPGTSRPLLLAGAPVLELYPFGPVVDPVALNVTAVPYADHLHVGLTADRDAVPQVAAIAQGLEQALRQLTKEAEGPSRR